jgi:hypothetical protein
MAWSTAVPMPRPCCADAAALLRRCQLDVLHLYRRGTVVHFEDARGLAIDFDDLHEAAVDARVEELGLHAVVPGTPGLFDVTAHGLAVNAIKRGVVCVRRRAQREGRRGHSGVE